MNEEKVKKTTEKPKSNPADRFPGPGPGRPKGSKNKIHGMTKEAIVAVLGELDIEVLLHDWALNKPELFKDLWKQLLPKAIEVSGEDGGPIPVQYVVQPVRPLEPKEE